MSVLKVGDTIMLDNDEVFQVLETVNFQDENYCLAVSAPETMEEAFMISKANPVFLKEVIGAETDKVFVEKVEDLGLIGKLKKEFLFEIVSEQ